MSKHTPGPWELLTIDGAVDMEADSKIRVKRIEIDQSGDHGHPGLAIVPLSNGLGLARNTANARLIAAAPEMLAELKRIHAEVLEHCEFGDAELASRLYGIIAKAEGK